MKSLGTRKIPRKSDTHLTRCLQLRCVRVCFRSLSCFSEVTVRDVSLSFCIPERHCPAPVNLEFYVHRLLSDSDFLFRLSRRFISET